MINLKRLANLFLTLAICWVVAPVALASDMVSAASSTLNMRAGPGTAYSVRWNVDRGYPFKVLARKGKWLKVSDFERDSGWIYGPMTSKIPYHVVSAPSATLRTAPNGRSAVVCRAPRGAVLRTLRKSGRWIKVRHERGTVGWVMKRQMWGW